MKSCCALVQQFKGGVGVVVVVNAIAAVDVVDVVLGLEASCRSGWKGRSNHHNLLIGHVTPNSPEIKDTFGIDQGPIS